MLEPYGVWCDAFAALPSLVHHLGNSSCETQEQLIIILEKGSLLVLAQPHQQQQEQEQQDFHILPPLLMQNVNLPMRRFLASAVSMSNSSLQETTTLASKPCRMTAPCLFIVETMPIHA